VSVTIEKPDAEARDILRHNEAIARAAAIGDVRYDLQLDLTQRAGTFRGAIIIDFSLAIEFEPSAAFLCFRGRTLESLRVNGVEIQRPEWNGYRLMLPTAQLKRGATNRVEAVYENAYDEGGDGVFQVIDPEDDAEYVYTNFEPYESHRMAPLFDQPDIKARLALRVLAPATWVVLANGAEHTVGAIEADGRTLRTFIETPPLATYLFAMAAGDFVGKRTSVPAPGRSEHVPVGLWSRRSLARFPDHDLFARLTEQAFAYYTELFGCEYPFAKLDHVYVPEFATGAMENVGLITYNESYLPRSTPTPSDITDIGECVLHEIAHMWFGNLVTMRWWDDLWLNESFATYVSYLCLTEGADFPGAWRQFNVQLKRWALVEDDAPTTHPIAGSVADTDQTFLNFDGITYGKGGAVLKQLGARLGRAGFSAGLRLHFQRHAFGNATLAQFIASLQEGSGVNLEAWTEQWLRTSGPSRLTALTAPESGEIMQRLTLHQAPASGDQVLREQLVRVALVRRGGGGALVIKSCEVLITGESVEVPGVAGTPRPLAIIPNLDDLAVGKIDLDPATLTFVARHLEEIPDGLLRQVVWSALWELVRDGRFGLADYAALLLDRLPHEPDSEIVQQVAESTVSAMLNWLPDGEREVIGSRLVNAARARLVRGGDAGMRITWSRILVLAAVTPRDVEEGWQVAVGETPLDGAEIDQDHRWSLLIRGASFGAPNTAERLRVEAQRDPSDRGVRALLAAETAIPSVAAKRRAWGRIFTPSAYGSVKKTLAAASGFAWPWQRALLEPYIAELPASLLNLGAVDATFARDLIKRSLPLATWNDPVHLIAAVDQTLTLADDPVSGLPSVDVVRLRRFLLSERDTLSRVVTQRTRRRP